MITLQELKDLWANDFNFRELVYGYQGHLNLTREEAIEKALSQPEYAGKV